MSIFVSPLAQQTARTCERGLRPVAAKFICLQLAHVRPYKTAHYSRVMPRTHVAASSSFFFPFFSFFLLFFFPPPPFVSWLLKAWRRSFLHASFLSSLSSFLRCPLSFSSSLTSSSPPFCFSLLSPFFSLALYFYPRRSTSSPLDARETCDTCKCDSTPAAPTLIDTLVARRRVVRSWRVRFPWRNARFGRFQKCFAALSREKTIVSFCI